MILRNADEAVAKWAGFHLGVEIVPPYVAWGITDRQGRLCGAMVFNDFADRNMELSIVSLNGVPRRAMIEAARYCFEQLQCERVTVRTRETNDTVIRLIKKAGFQQEGILRKWYGDDAALIFGMLKHECKFLRWKHASTGRKSQG